MYSLIALTVPYKTRMLSKLTFFAVLKSREYCLCVINTHVYSICIISNCFILNSSKQSNENVYSNAAHVYLSVRAHKHVQEIPYVRAHTLKTHEQAHTRTLKFYGAKIP